MARPTAKRDYLYRGLLRCGICGLRMWGNHRRNSTYYSCQPSHQRTQDIPADHPPHVYLNEQRLNDALLPFLATALFGPERTDYWRHALDAAAAPERAAPVKVRAEEIEVEIADLERRLTRQLVNLEADGVTSALRRRVGERVAELEDAIVVRRERLVALARACATEAPTLADVAPLLDRLPILAGMLDAAPQGELRALFDSLQLDVVYQPADSALDIAAPSTMMAARLPSPPHAKVRRTGRRTWPPTMRTSCPWSKGRRSVWHLGTPRSAVMATPDEATLRVDGAHATWTFVEPVAVGWGTGSPCSRKDWICRGIASAMSPSTSSREQPAATQPGRSGTYAPHASPSCSITTTYSVTTLPSRPAGLPPDRSKRTLRHFITRLAGHRHRSRPVGMAELAMRTDLPVEAPAVSLQRTDDVSYLHELRVRERCDGRRRRRTRGAIAALGFRAVEGRSQ